MTELSHSLEEERRIINAATAGPWERYGDLNYEVFCSANFEDSAYEPEAVTHGSDRPQDAEFIAHARTALPLRSAQLAAVLAKCDEITKDGEELMAEWHERGEESDEIELLSQGADLVEMARVIRRAIEEAGA